MSVKNYHMWTTGEMFTIIGLSFVIGFIIGAALL